MKEATIEQIADRANQLTGMMSHGQACFAACREMGVASEDLDAVASIVSTVLTNREINVSWTPEMVSNHKKAEADKAAQHAFVQKWAAATGRTGKSGKQSRQAHIRKLAKHGLNSDYARNMATEAGITN